LLASFGIHRVRQSAEKFHRFNAIAYRSLQTNSRLAHADSTGDARIFLWRLVFWIMQIFALAANRNGQARCPEVLQLEGSDGDQ
jgi:hypothetical protein